MSRSHRKPDRHDADRATARPDAVGLFGGLKIGYALIGGLAAMVHGRSRYTQDAGFVAEPGRGDAWARNRKTLARHGFDPGRTRKLYHHSGIGIDLWKDGHAAKIVVRAVRRKRGRRFAKAAQAHDPIAGKLRADRP